jgi:hypothetical protein
MIKSKKNSRREWLTVWAACCLLGFACEAVLLSFYWHLIPINEAKNLVVSDGFLRALFVAYTVTVLLTLFTGVGKVSGAALVLCIAGIPGLYYGGSLLWSYMDFTVCTAALALMALEIRKYLNHQ